MLPSSGVSLRSEAVSCSETPCIVCQYTVARPTADGLVRRDCEPRKQQGRRHCIGRKEEWNGKWDWKEASNPLSWPTCEVRGRWHWNMWSTHRKNYLYALSSEAVKVFHPKSYSHCHCWLVNVRKTKVILSSCLLVCVYDRSIPIIHYYMGELILT